MRCLRVTSVVYFSYRPVLICWLSFETGRSGSELAVRAVICCLAILFYFKARILENVDETVSGVLLGSGCESSLVLYMNRSLLKNYHDRSVTKAMFWFIDAVVELTCHLSCV